VADPSSFIANAHNELYAFYTGIGGLLEKNSQPAWDGRLHRALASYLNLPLFAVHGAHVDDDAKHRNRDRVEKNVVSFLLFISAPSIHAIECSRSSDAV